jgi:mono/diheme cytochrome c family protein
MTNALPLRLAPAVATLALAALALAGCRGTTSVRPPIHPNLNMDFQERFEEQEANPFFADGAAMRVPVAGTVARGHLRTTANAPAMLGRTAGGGYVDRIPQPVTLALIQRGQARYDIFCSTCHGAAGDGRGIVMVGNAGQGYGFTPAPTYHSEYLRGVPDGYLFEVIANGVRTMPSYGQQVPPADRWAIVAYIRALQRSQSTGAADIPEAERQRLTPAIPTVAPDAAAAPADAAAPATN